MSLLKKKCEDCESCQKASFIDRKRRESVTKRLRRVRDENALLRSTIQGTTAELNHLRWAIRQGLVQADRELDHLLGEIKNRLRGIK